MKAIIINRRLTKKEIQEMEQELTSEITIYKKPDIPRYFSGFDNYNTIPENEEVKKKINYSIIEEVLKFGELRANSQQSITDLFLFDTLSLWHYSKFRTYFAVRNLYYEIFFIQQLLKKYDNITYYGNQKYLETYFKGNNITFLFSQKTFPKIKYFEIFKFILVVLIRAVLDRVRKTNFSSKFHILVDNTIKQSILNLKTLKYDYSDTTFCYLHTMAEDSFVVLEDLSLPTKKPDYRFSIERWQFKITNKILGDVLLLKYLFKKHIRKEFFETLKKIDPLFTQVEAISLNEVQKTILYYFKKDIGASKLYLYKHIVYKDFFKKNKFKTITTIDENSPRFKSIIDAAKANNIKTVAIQHGALHDLHPAYLFTKEDTIRQIQADFTLVWGDYWKRFLIYQGNYPPSSLVITGQIRTDIIPKLLHTQIRIPELEGINKKIVVFASQPQRDAYLRRKAAEDVFNSVKNRKDCFLMIKLHPNEKNDFDYYHHIAKNTGITNYKIVFRVDLYLLFSRTDIVVTCFSTVGSEAVYFKKPLIILDHLKQDIQHYHQEGIAFQATNEHELKDYIDKMLNGALSINNEAYDRYIKKYAYKIDGKATNRVLQFIKNS